MAATNTQSSYKETGFTVIILTITARFLPPPSPQKYMDKRKKKKKKTLAAMQTNQDTNKRELKSNRNIAAEKIYQGQFLFP